MGNNESIEFKFSYLALKLLGKNLYSNAWAALSELVANSLDANAKNVYLYIDMRHKRKSTIEVFDDGDGMSFEELRDNYVHIGRNRRLDQGNSDSVMGRKGIGKLAALYLSRHYYVATKKENNQLYTYEMDFSREKEDSNDEHPEMNMVEFVNYDHNQFLSFSNGTMIRMENVDLKGYADVSVESLNNVLADFFAIDSIGDSNIYLKIITSESELEDDFKEVKKKTPFRNMVKIVCFDEETYKRINSTYDGNTYCLPYKKYKEHPYENLTEISQERIQQHMYTIPEKDDSEDGSNEKDKKKKFGEIKGWIGIHSSIESKIAFANDNSFKKNKLYNPLKLRVYVRNKLAIDNFLPTINNTQVFVNFIEGEISYDILDDNDFPDIATTSRQSMDENDGRIINLASDIKREITKLIKKRQTVSKEMAEKERILDIDSNTKAKEALANTIDKTVKKVSQESSESSIDQDELMKYASEIKNDVLRNVKGETLKRKYKIFFSHSRENKIIIDFFFYLLKNIGVQEEEMFYTSKDNRPEVEIKKSLADISKANIIDNNTIMFFYSTKSFLESEYCMFEGGAAWATRTQEDFFITFDSFSNIPKYLNFADEFLLGLTENSDLLSGVIYNGIVQSLNFLIKHINTGREINQESVVPMFQEVDFPDKVQLSNGERVTLDELIIRYWDTYVKKGVYASAKSQRFI
ncbi:ATP-binding protein [Enterococcus faecalis]|nr:ATP-binding protein [Enterococcus faecalis]